jgi:hypothetical protein
MELQHPVKAILSDVETKETRSGLAGTQLIDSSWRWLKKDIPIQMNAPRNAKGIQKWTEHIRFAQWMHMVGNSGKWEAFCKAASLYEDKTATQKAFCFTAVILIKAIYERRLQGFYEDFTR